MWLIGDDNISKKIYKNKNGNMELIDFIKLIHTNQLEDYMRKFSTLRVPCPPYELIDTNPNCFRCMDCFRNCISKVKEYKSHYQFGKIKFPKDELKKF